MSTRTYNKDEIIFRQGEYASEMFDILSGRVGIYAGYGTVDQTLLAVLNAGQFVGEMGMIEVYPRSATAVALENGTTLAAIDEKEFSSYFSEQPERLLEIMRQLADRLRDRTEDYQAACLIRDEMLATNKAPEKRSKSFLGRVKALIAAYNESMKSGNLPYDEFSGGNGQTKSSDNKD